jgi:type II secretory pathway pseudopilin PulG
MSFLEVIFATALFGIVAASILGVFSFTINAMSREQRQLACAEVAHRLIMAYMDDKTEMPDTNKTIEYGPGESPLHFRWEYREDPITLVEPKKDRRLKIRESPIRSDRFRQVTVRAWLAEESGGTLRPEESTPQITLTRMYDPLFMRNPDSFINMVMSPKGQPEFLRGLQGKDELKGNAPAPRSERFGGRRNRDGIQPRDAFQRGRSRRRMKGKRGAKNNDISEGIQTRAIAASIPDRRAFTLIETLLAASMGAALVLMVTAMFGFINRAETAQASRLEQVEGLARLQKVMTRAFSSLVVADPASESGFRSTVAGTEKAEPKEEVPARVLLEEDSSPGLDAALRRARIGGGGVVQRLEVVLDRPPLPRGFARGMGGSLATSAQANLQDDGTIAPSTSRGVFELRPDSATIRVDGSGPDRDGPMGWTLWWRPLIDEKSLDVDPTEDPEAVPVMSGLASCRWRAFVKRERKESIRVVTNMELPAHMELEVRTLGGQYANWMFEVQWSVGGDGTEEEAKPAEQPEGGRFKATEVKPMSSDRSSYGEIRR